MASKFKLTAETKTWFGRTLFRIEALIDFGSVKAGDKGGFVEAEKNLEQTGNAWVSGDAQVPHINIIGLHYNVTISDKTMQIGCENHLISEWADFDDRRILEMDGRRALKFWRDHKQQLMGICAVRSQSLQE